ncbi:MAG: dihydrofolate reductase family protein [Thermoleophilia bacterium]
MRRLGDAGGLEPGAFAGAERAAPADRPWVMVNMVCSVDGATAVDGESRALSGPADRALFHHLRGLADLILVGAGTVRADRYGPARPAPEVRAQRVARGQAPAPGIAVVAGRGELPWESALFTQAETPTLVITAATAPAPPHRPHLTAGQARVDVPDALAQLRRRDVRVLLCEGGPHLLGQLAAAGLIDEVFLTVSPRLVGGDSSRVMAGPEVGVGGRLVLAGIARDGEMLFLRYLRRPE